VLLVGANGLPRLAGLVCQLFDESCVAAPCTDSANWASVEVANQIQCYSKLDFAIQGSGLGAIVYVSDTGADTGEILDLATETSPGVWASEALTVCGGGPVAGLLPSMVLGPDGLPQVYFGIVSGDWPDAGAAVGHYFYSYQP
jgi:hypothetical protein